jgi:Tat protein translocase TatB subunit
MLSVPHLVVIFLVALVVLGPEKLPQVARTLGRAMAEFRRITGDFRMQIEDEMRDLERQARVRDMELSQKTTPATPPTALPAPTPERPEDNPDSPVPQAEPSAPEEGGLPVASAAPAYPEKPTDGES